MSFIVVIYQNWFHITWNMAKAKQPCWWRHYIRFGNVGFAVVTLFVKVFVLSSVRGNFAQELCPALSRFIWCLKGKWRELTELPFVNSFKSVVRIFAALEFSRFCAVHITTLWHFTLMEPKTIYLHEGCWKLVRGMKCALIEIVSFNLEHFFFIWRLFKRKLFSVGHCSSPQWQQTLLMFYEMQQEIIYLCCYSVMWHLPKHVVWKLDRVEILKGLSADRRIILKWVDMPGYGLDSGGLGKSLVSGCYIYGNDIFGFH
jgi:hypothetical protein